MTDINGPHTTDKSTVTINHPTKSKINIAAGIIAVANYLALRGYISEDAQQLVMELAGILGPVMIVIFRSFFTEKKDG